MLGRAQPETVAARGEHVQLGRDVRFFEGQVHPDAVGRAEPVVVGVDDEQWGQRVTGLVSLEEGAPAPSEEEIKAHLRTKVAGYKVPKEIFIVDEVFRAPNGKPDYRLSKKIATDLSKARRNS